MEILEDILKEQKSLRSTVEELRKEVGNSNKKPIVVNVDSSSITSEAYGALRQPISNVITELNTSVSASKSVTVELNKLKQANSIYGFTSLKSALYFGGIVLALVILLGSAVYAYMDSKNRLSEANRHIRVIDNQVKAWVEANPRDSESFKKEVEHELIAREY